MRHKQHLEVILPHQNESRTARLFFRSMKPLKRHAFDIIGWQIASTLKENWAYRESLAAQPEFAARLRDEPEKMAKLVHFVFMMKDVYPRAKLIDERISKHPSAFVLELHGAGIPHNIAGSGSKKEVNLGNGFSAIPFFELFEPFGLRPKPAVSKLLSDMALLAGFNLEAGYKLLSQIANRLQQHKERVICLEVPAERAVPLIVEGKPSYSLYFDSNGKLHPHISDFEQLYCLHSLEGKAFTKGDVNRIATLVLEPGKLF